MKICTKCKENKNLSDFRKDLCTRDQLSSWCKDCHREASRVSRKRNKTIDYDKQWKQNNKEKVRLHQKKHASNRNPETYKKYVAIRKLKYNYGLDQEQYLTLLSRQGYCCKICGIHQDRLNRKLNVDHCHITNKIRGLLCSNCNRAIGLLKDSIETLQKAIDYLK